MQSTYRVTLGNGCNFAFLHLGIFRDDTNTESHPAFCLPPSSATGSWEGTDCDRLPWLAPIPKGLEKLICPCIRFFSLFSLFFSFLFFSFLFFSLLASSRFKSACFALFTEYIPSFHFVRGYRDVFSFGKYRGRRLFPSRPYCSVGRSMQGFHGHAFSRSALRGLFF